MIHKVTIKTDIGQGMTVEHSFEHITETEEDARVAGQADALLAKAWGDGFAEADLS